MPETCADLVQYEPMFDTLLRQHCGPGVPRDCVLGELPLTKADVERLTRLVVLCLKKDFVAGAEFLAEKAAACLAVFLVWRGIEGYREGDYWSAVRGETGVTDRRLESRLGDAFLNFLKERDLVPRPDTRAHRYVTPILLHAGIPDSCLPEYFRQIAWGRFVNRDIREKHDIRAEVSRMRAEAKRADRPEVQDQIDRLSSRRRRLERVRKLMSEYKRLAEALDEDESAAGAIRKVLGVVDDLEELRASQDVLLQKVEKLDAGVINSETKLRRFSTLLENAERHRAGLMELESGLIRELDRFFTRACGEQWELDLYRRLVPANPRQNWHWLKLMIRAGEITRAVAGGEPRIYEAGEQGKRLLERQAVYCRDLTAFQKTLTGIWKDLTDGCPEEIWKRHGMDSGALTGEEFCLAYAADFLVLLARIRDDWREGIAAARDRRSEIEDPKAGLRAVEQKLNQVDARVDEKTQELKRLTREAPGLREHGDIPKARVLNKMLTDLEGAAAAGGEQLERLRGECSSLLGRRVDPNAVRRELEQVQAQLRALDDEISGIEREIPMGPLVWLDRPVQRFLLYGGRAADSFILRTVTLLVSALEEGEPRLPDGWPGTYRYERIWEAFSTWWREEGRELSAIRSRLPRPRIVCWREDSWQVGVQIPEELLDVDGLSVRHNGELLDESAWTEGCWPLTDLDGAVEMGGINAPAMRLDRLQQKGRPCFIFRGWDDSTGPLPAAGRVVKGKVTVAAPKEWSRDSSVAGPAPVADEPAAIPGYRVHFFDLAREAGMVSFVLPDGSHLTLEAGAGRFELLGDVLGRDPDHEMGPLIAGRPPRIRPVRPSIWKETGRVVLVTRARRGRESVEFRAPDNVNELDLVTARGQLEGGCYWVVVYDREQYEIERLPFRFMPGLVGVKTKPQSLPLFPPAEGHQPTAVQFIFDPGSVRAAQADMPDGDVTGEWADHRLRVGLPAHPRFDRADLEGERQNRIFSFGAPAGPRLSRRRQGLRAPDGAYLSLQIDRPRDRKHTRLLIGQSPSGSSGPTSSFHTGTGLWQKQLQTYR